MPSIYLGMPIDNQLYQVVEENLRFHGFTVSRLTCTEAFHYDNLFQRIGIKFRQKILGDRKIKKRIHAQRHAQKMLPQLIEHDYALFIRGDIFTDELLDAVRKHSRTGSVNYQWDGISRYPDIQQKYAHFDRFFVFDPNDYHSNEYGFLPTTNFYFDHLALSQTINNTLYFVGSHQPTRQPTISQFAQYALQHDIPLNFHIICKRSEQRKFYPQPNIQWHKRVFSFEENLQRMLQSRVLVDFLEPIHNGLSLRPFEALGYRKKLITNHKGIIEYDFYHPNNIFILNGKNFDGLLEFLATPYQELTPEIYQKYSFGNWIRYVLNIEPHLPITLPPYNK